MILEPSTTSGEFLTYAEFAHAIYETGVLSDPWLDGNERFGMTGVVLNTEQAHALAAAAERVAYLHQELVEILLDRPKLLREFYRLTPYQQAMWESSGGLWHGMARADLFICEDGKIVCCELNSDTPSGQPEAIALNQILFATHAAEHNYLCNPNTSFEQAYIEILRESNSKRTDEGLSAVGIIYPTELTEDLGMVTLLARWLEKEGIKVITGSPFNLRRGARGVEVLGEPVDLIIRHYKTDWWSERVPVWKDVADYPDAEPLTTPLAVLLDADLAGEVTIVNPFGSVVTQNKLSLAFFWEHQGLFTSASQDWIRELIPETRRMMDVPVERLRDEREAWVLKSDYGCEGSETICGAFVSDQLWRRAIETAKSEHFVVQRFFRVAPEAEGRLPNYGVYLLGGAAAGFFTRLAKGSTGISSVVVPTFVAK